MRTLKKLMLVTMLNQEGNEISTQYDGRFDSDPIKMWTYYFRMANLKSAKCRIIRGIAL